MPEVTRVISDARLVLPQGVRNGCVVLRGGTIAGVHPGDCPMPSGAEVVEARGRILAPGLVDVHVHGGGGFDLMSADPDAVRAYARWVASHGVTGFLASTCGRDHADTLARVRAMAPLARERPHGARMLGIHLEGPYINPKRKGAFPPAWLRPPSVAEYQELAEAADGALRVVTLAPELPGALELIDAVLESGAVAAIGHTDATHDEAQLAIDRGATHVTHCFNAMRPFGHRDAGVLGAVLGGAAMTVELIGDGAHVEWPAARVLLRACGAGRVVLVTDGMPLAGTPDGESDWEGQRIRVDGGKAVRVADNTIIGGVITLDDALRNAVRHLGVSLPDASRMASRNPARAIGLAASHGELVPGAPADFALFDDDLRGLETWVAGERVFERAAAPA